MTEGKVVLYNRDYGKLGPIDHLVGFNTPSHFLQDYYKILKKGGPVYCILCVDPNSKPRLFFEQFGRSKNEYVSRVFFRKDDAVEYSKVVKEAKMVSSKLAVWDCTVRELLATYRRIFDKEDFLQRKNKTYHTITTMLYCGEFRDVETFWSENKDIML